MTGRAFHSPFFMMRAAPGDGTTRIAAATPSKVAKTAVMRNRLRRRTYAAVRMLSPKMKDGFRVILLAKAPLIEARPDALLRDIEALFVKAGLLR